MSLEDIGKRLTFFACRHLSDGLELTLHRIFCCVNGLTRTRVLIGFALLVAKIVLMRLVGFGGGLTGVIHLLGPVALALCADLAPCLCDPEELTVDLSVRAIYNVLSLMPCSGDTDFRS